MGMAGLPSVLFQVLPTTTQDTIGGSLTPIEGVLISDFPLHFPC